MYGALCMALATMVALGYALWRSSPARETTRFSPPTPPTDTGHAPTETGHARAAHARTMALGAPSGSRNAETAAAAYDASLGQREDEEVALVPDVPQASWRGVLFRLDRDADSTAFPQWLWENRRALRDKYATLIGARMSTIGLSPNALSVIGHCKIRAVVLGPFFELLLESCDRMPLVGRVCVRGDWEDEWLLLDRPVVKSFWSRTLSPRHMQVEANRTVQLPALSPNYLYAAAWQHGDADVARPVLEMVLDYVGPAFVTRPTWTPLTAWFGPGGSAEQDRHLKPVLLRPTTDASYRFRPIS
jgi:hypothetical protein